MVNTMHAMGSPTWEDDPPVGTDVFYRCVASLTPSMESPGCAMGSMGPCAGEFRLRSIVACQPKLRWRSLVPPQTQPAQTSYNGDDVLQWLVFDVLSSKYAHHLDP